MQESNQCPHCAQSGIRERRATRCYGRDENLLVVENVPTFNCPHCGETWLLSETLRQLDELRRQGANALAHRSVAVAKLVA